MAPFAVELASRCVASFAVQFLRKQIFNGRATCWTTLRPASLFDLPQLVPLNTNSNLSRKNAGRRKFGELVCSQCKDRIRQICYDHAVKV
jgi:hypothetical protein